MPSTTGPCPLPVFIDCEFTSLTVPRLLSIGLVAGDALECYAELTQEARPKRSSPFVNKSVFAQFGLVAGAEASVAKVGHKVGGWLLALDAPAIMVCYDYHADMDLLEELLKVAGLWEKLKSKVIPAHVGYLLGDSGVKQAMADSWQASFVAQGIGRHHALADARALQAGYRAMHESG